MWPWGHVGVAYLVYSGYTRGRFRRPPRPEAAVAVVIGALLADLIDKPLAWGVGVFPTGRDLAHSLFFAGALLLLAAIAAAGRDWGDPAAAFVIAHLSHLVGDLPRRAFLGYPFGTEFLLWPVLSHRTFQYSKQLFEAPAVVELIVAPLTEPLPFFIVNIALFLLALGVWDRDGRPGLQVRVFRRAN